MPSSSRSFGFMLCATGSIDLPFAGGLIDGRRNNGAPDVYGGIEDLEVHHAHLDKACDESRTQTYRPRPGRRVFSPKPDGRQRALGIHTVRDRIAQTAPLLIFESIFEADFQKSSYGFSRSARVEMSLKPSIACVSNGSKGGWISTMRTWKNVLTQYPTTCCKITSRCESRMVGYCN